MGEVCIANINERERRKRLGFGLFQLAASAGILGALLTSHASRWWRLALFPLYFGGAVGIFQWRDRTCVGMAALGSRRLGDQVERIEDSAELAQVRAQARRVQLRAVLTAAPLSLLSLILRR